ncbi:MAG: acyltransferase family protein [Terriglobales bacterium]
MRFLRQHWRSPIRRYIPELDGLRAFAILGVLMVHCNFPFHTPWLEMVRSWGWAGVDLFFVISGYLITSILLGSRERPHYFRNFYARRGLRIWPLYYLLLIYIFAVTPHLGKWARQDVDLHQYPWPYYALYIQNLVLKHLGSFALVITWSLCVEEQFYLLWPVVVRWCSRRKLEIGLLVVLVVELLLRYYMKYSGNGMYGFITWCRLDALAAGALIVLRPKWMKHGWVALPAALWLLWRQEWVLVYSALAIGFASIVAYLVSTPNRFLAWTPVSFTGKISYGIYIMHPLVFSIFWKTPLNWGVEHVPHANLIRMVGQVLLPIPFAALSWHLFEKPILGLKKYFDSDSQPKTSAAREHPPEPLRGVLPAEAGD